VSHKNNNLADPEQRQGAVWFALLSVAWLQLALALHQFEHVAEYVEDSCQVCIQLDRVDDVAADRSTSTSMLSTIGNLVPRAPASVVGLATIRGFDSRAPPRL